MAFGVERYHQRHIYQFKIYSNMVTMKFSATKSETLFLTPTIAAEQNSSETAIRFALWHSVFSIEVSKSHKIVKAK
nr:MAG TPA: hypothetical protein [Caudoviricetes sp.]